ncbi:MAG: hypothetical protein H0T42_30975 [Deltaproteobacteria bacterium]|nr:hypothetical protein [Deltaproteobacteria bacterium]
MPLAPDIVAGVSRRLVEHAGLELPTWVVEARTLARIAALRVTPEAYVELIATVRGAAELRELVEAVRVGESSLFRHRTQIAALADVVAPALRDRGRRSVRVWSAGCASGEEPYTLALVLSRALPDHTISIVATDVSDDALEAAQRATYPISELADVPTEYRESFTTEGDRIRVRSAITRLVRFERANLLDAVPPRNCDVVWCRNVLIYFSVAARRRAIDRLVSATLPGGFVFVGYSESLREVTELESQRAGDAVFYVKRGDWSVVERTPVPELAPRAKPNPSQPTIARPTPPTGLPIVGRAPSDQAVLVLSGSPLAAEVTNLVGEQLATTGLRRLTIDLDSASMLEDDLAPVLRRACAAARGAGVEIVLRATRTGAKRWVSRHSLDEVSG